MKNLIIVGAGGFFLELYDYLISDTNALGVLNLKGLLDDNKTTSQTLLPYLGVIADYEPQPEDVFLIAIGNALARNRIFEMLKDKGAHFFTYIHPTAIVSKTASIGEGCIIAPQAVINASAVLNDNVVVNVHCSVGHEAQVGSSSVLSPYSALNGCAKIGELCFLGTRATIFPGKIVGNKSIVDSHSYVKADVPPKSIVSIRGEYIVVQNRLMR